VDYFNTQEGDALVTMEDSADPRQDGWDDDFDVEEDDDPDDTERLGEDEDCRRKVSQGRPSASPTFAFSSTSVVHRHGAGRGGGSHGSTSRSPLHHCGRNSYRGRGTAKRPRERERYRGYFP